MFSALKIGQGMVGIQSQDYINHTKAYCAASRNAVTPRGLLSVSPAFLPLWALDHIGFKMGKDPVCPGHKLSENLIFLCFWPSCKHWFCNAAGLQLHSRAVIGYLLLKIGWRTVGK